MGEESNPAVALAIAVVAIWAFVMGALVMALVWWLA